MLKEYQDFVNNKMKEQTEQHNVRFSKLENQIGKILDWINSQPQRKNQKNNRSQK